MKIFTTLNPQNNKLQIDAINSWRGYEIYSINTKEEIKKLKLEYRSINFIETTNTTDYKRKKLIKLDAFLEAISKFEEPCAIVNSDIILKEDYKFNFNERLLKNSLIIGCRYEVQDDKKYVFDYGYDLFIMNPSHANLFKNNNYTIGLPWWDYWLPVSALMNGLNVYNTSDEIIYHKTHPTNYEMKIWYEISKKFFDDVFKSYGITESDLTEEEFFSWGRDKMDIKKFIELKSIKLDMNKVV